MGKKLAFRLVLVFLLGIITFFVLFENQILLESPFNLRLMFNNPSVAASDNEGNMYVIDNSMKRILKLSSAGEAEYTIEGGKRGPGEFFFAYEVTTDNSGNLYVLNNVLDESGMYVQAEEILKYDPKGKFEKVVYSKEYKDISDMPMRKGRICGLRVSDGHIHCFYKYKDSFEEYNILIDTGAVELERKCTFADAENMLIDISCNTESQMIAFSTKKGEIYTVGKDNTPVLLY